MSDRHRAAARSYRSRKCDRAAVPAGVTNEQAVFTEPLAAAFGITEQVAIGPETSIAVIGDGKLGLLCAMSLGLLSHNVTVVGKHLTKLAIAEKNGLRAVLAEDVRPEIVDEPQ